MVWILSVNIGMTISPNRSCPLMVLRDSSNCDNLSGSRCVFVWDAHFVSFSLTTFFWIGWICWADKRPGTKLNEVWMPSPKIDHYELKKRNLAKEHETGRGQANHESVVPMHAPLVSVHPFEHASLARGGEKV